MYLMKMGEFKEAFKYWEKAFIQIKISNASIRKDLKIVYAMIHSIIRRK